MNFKGTLKIIKLSKPKITTCVKKPIAKRIEM